MGRSKRMGLWIPLAVIWLLSGGISTAASSDLIDPAAFTTALAGLQAETFEEKEQAIRQLANSRDPRALEVLMALQQGACHAVAETGDIVILQEQGEVFTAKKVLTGEVLNPVDPDTLDKIGINNPLRGVLKGLIAAWNLHHPEAAVRLAAVNQLAAEATAETIVVLRDLLATEQEATIRQAIAEASALVDLASADLAAQQAAVTVLSDSLQPEVYNRLQQLVATTAPGDELHRTAVAAVQAIDRQLAFYRFVEMTLFGLSLGSILLLIAIGLSITFGVMGVINMAHGELMMLGAYTTYLVQAALPNFLEYSLLLAIPLAFLVSGGVGVLIERGVIRFLYGRPLETLLATFGISLILQQIPRTFISAQNVAVQNPAWLSGSWVINPALSITYNRLFIFLFALMVFMGLLLIMKQTRLGLQVRAVAQNRVMARAMGVRTQWIDALTFGLGSGIAGIAGVALSQVTNVGPNLGQAYIVDSFMVVVFGGVGNVWGTLVAALSLGAVNKYLEPWTGAVLAKIFILVFIILFIQKRPKGLFPQKGRAVE